MFCSVFEEESISKAAQLSYVSQPAVTKQIRQLEEHYNILLFDRLHGKLAPTQAGKVLYPFIKSTLETLNQSHEAISEVSKNHDVVINIGASYTIGDYLMPGIIGSFKQTFPHYKLSLMVSNTPQIVKELKSQNIDIALVEGLINDESLLVETFAQDQLVIVTPANHKWKNKDVVSLYELLGERIIWREPESGLRKVLEKAFEDADILNKVSFSVELGSIQSIKKAVELGVCISFLPKLAIEKELAQGVLNITTVSNINFMRNFLMIQEPQRFNKKATQEFAKFVQKEVCF